MAGHRRAAPIYLEARRTHQLLVDIEAVSDARDAIFADGEKHLSMCYNTVPRPVFQAATQHGAYISHYRDQVRRTALRTALAAAAGHKG